MKQNKWWQRFKTRWAIRSRKPTPASRILPVVTRVVKLPLVSALAGREIRVRIGVAPQAEFSAVFDKSLVGESTEEGLARLKKISADEVQKLDRKAERAIEALLRAAVLDPPIAPVAGGLPSGTIPYAAIQGDRFILIRHITLLSSSWWGMCNAFNAKATAAPAQTGGVATEAPQAEAARGVPGQSPSK